MARGRKGINRGREPSTLFQDNNQLAVKLSDAALVFALARRLDECVRGARIEYDTIHVRGKDIRVRGVAAPFW